MARRSPQSSAWLAQGGVALADILANSVAVILILIIVTITAQQKKSQDEITQNADITSILARQLASSIVYNDLPSSPPAVLHDYRSCAIAHDCNHYLYPVLELYDGYMRIFNTNTRIYRNELLRNPNALDRYLKSLPPQQADNIRIDIHGISEYYLVMGILQENNMRSRHWHFLGEHVPGLNNPIDATELGNYAYHRENPESSAGGQFNDDSSTASSESQSGQPDLDGGQSNAMMSYTMGTEQADFNTLSQLNYDSLLPPSANASGDQGSSSSQSHDAFSPGRGGGQFSQRTPSTLFDALVGMMAESRGLVQEGSQQGRGSSGAQSDQRQSRFHIPNVNGQLPGEDGDNSLNIELSAEDYHAVVLAYIFKMLKEARREETFLLSQARDWLLELARNPAAIKDHPHAALIESMAQAMRADIDAGYVPLDKVVENPLPFNALVLNPNQVPSQAQLLFNRLPRWIAPILASGEIQPQMVLRSFPTLYKGETLDFPKAYTLVVHPDEWADKQQQWRPVAIIDPQLSDISMGFVYAALDDNGAIELLAGPNLLRLNQVPLAQPVVSEADETQINAPILWALAMIGFLLLVNRLRVRRHA